MRGGRCLKEEGEDSKREERGHELYSFVYKIQIKQYMKFHDRWVYIRKYTKAIKYKMKNLYIYIYKYTSYIYICL